MKNLYILILLLSSCSSVRISEKFQSSGDKVYLVKHIKRLRGWNIIYVTNGDSLFKVITKRQPLENRSCKIRKGHSYRLELHWILENMKPPLSNYADVGCFDYGPKLRICTEPAKGIYKLYYTPSIKGLCYVGNE